MPVTILVIKYSNKRETKSLEELEGILEGVSCGLRSCDVRIFAVL